jgi:hypothetical protein
MKRLACLCALIALPSLCMAEKPSAQMTVLVKRYASRYNVPQELISALIDVESRWNPRAVSPKSAIGLMQLMPGHGTSLRRIQSARSGTEHRRRHTVRHRAHA